MHQMWHGISSVSTVSTIVLVVAMENHSITSSLLYEILLFMAHNILSALFVTFTTLAEDDKCILCNGAGSSSSLADVWPSIFLLLNKDPSSMHDPASFKIN